MRIGEAPVHTKYMVRQGEMGTKWKLTESMICFLLAFSVTATKSCLGRLTGTKAVLNSPKRFCPAKLITSCCTVLTIVIINYSVTFDPYCIPKQVLSGLRTIA